jgi:glutathione-regulated potassium-efflux system ancillary protein KefG
VGRKVDVDDLIDSSEVAQILGLSNPNSVHLYLSRYPTMPRPVVDRGKNRARLWLRSEIDAWAAHRRNPFGIKDL